MPSKTINLNSSSPLFSPTFRQTLSASIYSTSCAPPLSLLLGLPGAHNSIRRSPANRSVVGRSTTLLVRDQRREGEREGADKTYCLLCLAWCAAQTLGRGSPSSLGSEAICLFGAVRSPGQPAERAAASRLRRRRGEGEARQVLQAQV